MSDSISVMRRGAIREVLDIQNQVSTPIPGGSHTATYQVQGTIRAEVEPLRGTEDIQARQLTGRITYRIRTDMKLPAKLGSKSRLIWRSVSPSRTLELLEPPRPSNLRQQIVFLVAEKES